MFKGTTAKTQIALFLQLRRAVVFADNAQQTKRIVGGLFSESYYRQNLSQQECRHGTWCSNCFSDGYCESVLQDQVLQLIVYTELFLA